MFRMPEAYKLVHLDDICTFNVDQSKQGEKTNVQMPEPQYVSKSLLPVRACCIIFPVLRDEADTKEGLSWFRQW